MGVPVVSLAGRNAAGRCGVSMLTNVGLPQFIADDVDRYVAIARQWANDLPALAELRAAEVFPWDARRTLYWRTVFPQMTNWLPDDEAAQLRFEFETEIRRLEAA